MDSKRSNILAVCGKIISVSSLLVIISYWFVDRPVAIWMHKYHFTNSYVLEKFTQLPVLAAFILFLGVLVIIVRFSKRPLQYGERVWLAMFISYLIAIRITDVLKGVFGRYWPATWTHNNPSLLSNDAYGFHWFHIGPAYKSFPSGHTTVTIAIAAVLWLTYPHRRVSIAAIALLPLIGLIGMDYHFVGDVFGGICVGSLTAFCTVKLMGIRERN